MRLDDTKSERQSGRVEKRNVECKSRGVQKKEKEEKSKAKQWNEYK